MIALTRAAVAGPVPLAQATIRPGVHSAWRRCASGMCAASVVKRLCSPERRWLATLLPLWRTSTIAAVTRMSHPSPTS